MMIDLYLTDSLRGKKEKFIPLNDKKVKMYVCGITPYDYSHIGHGRSYVDFDVLFRLLAFLGYDVTYVRNFTDIDDKILNKAISVYRDISKYRLIADEYISLFEKDMKALNCLKPTYEPRVTDNIDEIINFIKELINKGYAYIVEHDVYFDTSRFKEYGKLSKRKKEDVQAGARVEISSKKRQPEDFVLWKGNNEHLFWKSEWGYGRPGWHIECSVLARKFLGDTIDIHGGGSDLIFPHHENEIAQSEALTGKPFVRYWVHNAFVMVEKEKMSKSLGNYFTLHAIFEKFDPMVLRFYFLQHHYRTPIDFNLKSLDAAKGGYERLTKIFGIDDLDTAVNLKIDDIDLSLPPVREFLSCLADDLNTPKSLAVIFENQKEIQAHTKLRFYLKFLCEHLLGIKLKSYVDIKITPQIQELIEKREKARQEKNWELADSLREELKKLGYIVQDKKLEK